MEQLKEITQKSQMHPLIKKFMKVFLSMFYQIVLSTEMSVKGPDINQFNLVLTGLFRALFR